MEIYVVQENDTLGQISQAWGVDVEELMLINQLPDPDQLVVGQALLIPAGQDSRPSRQVFSLGYAYPFISQWVLEQSLPYLSAIHVFSYGFTTEGELVEPVISDQRMIHTALLTGSAPVLTFTSIGQDGRFHSSLIHALLSSPSLQQKVIWELGRVMAEKGFQGLDIDFEYVPAEDREALAQFVALARQVFGAFGYPVSVALAPKISDSQEGLLYEGVDYGLLGQAADQVLLMTYEWGYAYGPPMAVAPLYQVRRVAEYALSRIPASKIILGIPNYGYDWPLPYTRGVTRARTLGNVEAVRLAAENQASIEFDQESQSPFFHYTRDGIRHEVWFEDVRSWKAKFDLIQELGLKGPGFWQMMQFFRAGLLLMADTFSIIRESEEIS